MSPCAEQRRLPGRCAHVDPNELLGSSPHEYPLILVAANDRYATIIRGAVQVDGYPVAQRELTHAGD
jgi:hypothetical protein